jgi:hypothetical protein
MRQLQQEGKEDEVVVKFKGQLPAAALNFIMSPLDFSYRQLLRLPQQYVGAAYLAAEGDYESVKERMDEAVRMCSMCEYCLLLQLQHPEQQVRCVADSDECDRAAGTTCEQCAESFSSTYPLLRPCHNCHKAGRHCLRAAVLLTGMDDDAKQLKYMKMAGARSEDMFQQVCAKRLAQCLCIYVVAAPTHCKCGVVDLLLLFCTRCPSRSCWVPGSTTFAKFRHTLQLQHCKVQHAHSDTCLT